MSQKTWDAVDAYVGTKMVGEDDALLQAVADCEAAGMPMINVMPAHGKMLHLFAKMLGARRILEVGTLGGYSAIWMARALPKDGELVTLEISDKHSDVARKNLERAGVSDRVRVIVAPAIETLKSLDGPFDMAFIDADKQSTSDYFAHAVRLVRPGGAVIVDNVVRGGDVANADTKDEASLGIRRFNDSLANHKNVSATTIQTVGTKGYDGLTLAIVS